MFVWFVSDVGRACERSVSGHIPAPSLTAHFPTPAPRSVPAPQGPAPRSALPIFGPALKFAQIRLLLFSKMFY